MDSETDSYGLLSWLQANGMRFVVCGTAQRRLKPTTGLREVNQIRAELGASEGAPPIVAVTAHGQLEQQERCLDAGMSDVLAKPFRVDELRDVLLRWLSGPAQARLAALDAEDAEATRAEATQGQG